jgi:integrase
MIVLVETGILIGELLALMLKDVYLKEGSYGFLREKAARRGMCTFKSGFAYLLKLSSTQSKMYIHNVATQQVLGHSSLEMVHTYVRLFSNEVRE